MTKTTYTQIDLAGWEKVGEGGNGSVYTCPVLGHIQTLNWHERLFLGLLVKSLMK